MATKKSSVSSRLDFARQHNSSVAVALRSESVDSEPESEAAALTTATTATHPSCICNREAQTLVCIDCKMFVFGRIRKLCPTHKNVTYLMDFRCCPYCSGPAEHLHVVEIDYYMYSFYKP